MHDNAPCHRSKVTRDKIEERGITAIFQPALSPDLNPIKHVQNKMKNWLQKHYPDLPGGRQYGYNEIRRQVQEAWDAITPEYLQSLVNSIRDRCQAVINTEGGYTRF